MTQYSIISKYPHGFVGNGARCITAFGEYGSGSASLKWPWFCDITKEGDIFIADTENDRIQFYQSRTYRPCAEAFGPPGRCYISTANRNKSPCTLLSPKSVKSNCNPGTSLAIADTGNRRVVILKIEYHTSPARMEYVHSFGDQMFHEPTDISVSKTTGRIAVVDTAVHRVSIHSPDGRLIALCHQPNFDLCQPSAVSFSDKGELFVSDTGNSCIRRYSADGQFLDTLGRKGTAVGQFDNVRGLSFNDKGYLFVADEYNNRVQMFSPDLTHVTEAVSSIPLPKGVAAGTTQLIVTAADDHSFAKVYYP